MNPYAVVIAILAAWFCGFAMWRVALRARRKRENRAERKLEKKLISTAPLSRLLPGEVTYAPPVDPLHPRSWDHRSYGTPPGEDALHAARRLREIERRNGDRIINPPVMIYDEAYGLPDLDVSKLLPADQPAPEPWRGEGGLSGGGGATGSWDAGDNGTQKWQEEIAALSFTPPMPDPTPSDPASDSSPSIDTSTNTGSDQ